MKEAGVLANATAGKWHVILGDDLEVQVDAGPLTFSFHLLRLGVLQALLAFCRHERDQVWIGRFGSWWTGSDIEILWDQEFSKTRAFVKSWKSNRHLLMFALEGEDLLSLRACVQQLLEDTAR